MTSYACKCELSKLGCHISVAQKLPELQTFMFVALFFKYFGGQQHFTKYLLQSITSNEDEEAEVL